MTKLDLAKTVARTANITDILAKTLVQSVFDCMIEALARGETLEFRGFGVFKTRIRKPRIGRNPRAGIVVQVPERKVIVWKMGKGLRERIKQ